MSPQSLLVHFFFPANKVFAAPDLNSIWTGILGLQHRGDKKVCRGLLGRDDGVTGSIARRAGHACRL